MTRHSLSLQSLFSPRSIALVGASNTPGKTGAVPLELLRKHGYDGCIYPVNPREKEVQGLPCHAALSDIEADIDLAIVAIPASQARAALEQARPQQVRNAVIFTSGFAEVGEAGKEEQRKLQAWAQGQGARLLGPNCLGFMNMRQQAYATFSPAPLNGAVPAGEVGMVSQSGAFGAYAYSMARERGLGLSFWISTGNESDVDVADCLQWLVEDEGTRVIMAYMEGCKNGDKLKNALAAAARADKPVIVTKIGRTASGARAAASHTAALAGDDAVYEALFRQYGAIRAHSIDEFFNLGHALTVWKGRHNRRSLGIMSISGGVGALMADEADDIGLELPPVPAPVQQRLLQRISFASASNPIDVTGQAITDPGILLDTAKGMLETGDYGALAVFLAAAGSSERLWPHIETLATELGKHYPGVPLAISALLPAERRHALEKVGCMVFADPSTAIRTIGTVLTPRRVVLPSRDSGKPRHFRLPTCTGVLSEADSLQILKRAGIPVLDFNIAQSSEDAQRFATDIGGRVVMKVVSPDIAHKSDVGGVKLGIQGSDAVREAYDAIQAAVQRNAPSSKIDGIMVAPMIKDGIECIMGVHDDPIFGPVVMFGLGGIFVELLKDVSFRLAPFDEAEALGMIRETRAVQLLEGARGQPPCDIPALARALSALSQLAYSARGQIGSIDVNPIVALPRGRGVVALDALVVMK